MALMSDETSSVGKFSYMAENGILMREGLPEKLL